MKWGKMMKGMRGLFQNEWIKLCCRRQFFVLIAGLLLGCISLSLIAGQMSPGASYDMAEEMHSEYARLRKEYDWYDRSGLTQVQNDIAQLYMQVQREMFDSFEQGGFLPVSSIDMGDDMGVPVYFAYQYEFSRRAQEVNQGQMSEADLQNFIRSFPFYFIGYSSGDPVGSNIDELSQQLWNYLSGLDFQPERELESRIAILRQKINQFETSGQADQAQVLKTELEWAQYRFEMEGWTPGSWRWKVCNQLEEFQGRLRATQEEGVDFDQEAGTAASSLKESKESKERIEVYRYALEHGIPPKEYVGWNQAARRHMLQFLPFLLVAAAAAGVFASRSIRMEQSGGMEGLLCRCGGRGRAVVSKFSACLTAAAGVIFICLLCFFAVCVPLYGAGDLNQPEIVFLFGKAREIPFLLWFAGCVLRSSGIVVFAPAAALLFSVILSGKRGAGTAAGILFPAGMGLWPLIRALLEWQRCAGSMSHTGVSVSQLILPPYYFYQAVVVHLQNGWMNLALVFLAIILVVVSIQKFRKIDMYK